jgi:hypothetical protein
MPSLTILLLPFVLSFSFYIDPIEVIYDISFTTPNGKLDLFTRAVDGITNHPLSLAYDPDNSTYYKAASATSERSIFQADVEGITSVTLLTAGGSNNQFSQFRPVFYTHIWQGTSNRVIIGVSCQEITLAFNNAQFDTTRQSTCKLSTRNSTLGPTVKFINTYYSEFVGFLLLPSDIWIYDYEHTQIIKYTSAALEWEYISLEEFGKYFNGDDLYNTGYDYKAYLNIKTTDFDISPYTASNNNYILIQTVDDAMQIAELSFIGAGEEFKPQSIANNVFV